MPQPTNTLVAVDIGNSRIKLGRFDRNYSSSALPIPTATLELPLENSDGDFELSRIEPGCEAHVMDNATWRISTVHSGATVRLIGKVKQLACNLDREWPLHCITNDEVPRARD